MTTAWSEFLAEADKDMRRGEMNRGLSWSPPDPSVRTVDAVAEYMTGFGWCGVGAREVIKAVDRDERGVKRALRMLVDDGKVAVRETLTRGPKASRRKVYFPVDNGGPFVQSMPEFDPGAHDRERPAGGGRQVRPAPMAE